MTASILYWFLLGVAVKSFAVLGVAWLAAVLLRKSSASVRHLVWSAAFAALLVLPLLSVVLPALHVSIAGPSLSPSTFAIDATATAQQAGVGSASADPITPASLSWFPDWRLLLLSLWAAGAAISLVQMCIGWGAMLHLRRKSRPFDLHDLETPGRLLAFNSAVSVLQAAPGSMPMTYGLRNATVYMPADAAHWTTERRRAVLLHELAHVMRRDHVTHLMARFALALYWWNPLAWAAWREFLKERETAADDVVLGAGECASDYASHLLELARSLETRTAFGWAGVSAARRSQLEGRLLSILDAGRNRKAAGGFAACIVLFAALAAVVPVAAMQAGGHSARALLPQQSAGAAAELIKQGDIAREEGKLDQARALYTKVLALSRTGPDAATALIHLGTVELAAKQIEPAIADFAQAQSADSPKPAEALLWTAIAREQQNNPEAAGAFFQSALAAANPSSTFAATIMDLYAQFLMQQGRNDEAQSLRQQASEIRKAQTAQVLATISPSANVKRIGSEVKAPVLISKTEPKYTAEARLAKYQGTILVYINVDTEGTPRNIKVIRGLGFGLDERAIDAISQWRFKPAMQAGQPVPVEAHVEVNFRLL